MFMVYRHNVMAQETCLTPFDNTYTTILLYTFHCFSYLKWVVLLLRCNTVYYTKPY